MKGKGLMDLARRATRRMLQPRGQQRDRDLKKDTAPDAKEQLREYRRAARANRQDRKLMLHRKTGKGIVGYQTNAKAPRYPPLRFIGKRERDGAPR